MADIFPKKKSDIQKVRDQLTLDHATTSHLDTVTENLGITRPKLPISDDVWRAVVKLVALDYKQIARKFNDLLAVMLGPKTTQCSGLQEDAVAGNDYIVAVTTASFPQTGTIVIDEGLPIEERIRYTFIDRYSNVVYLASPLVYDHPAVKISHESTLIAPATAGDNKFNIYEPIGFISDLPGPYTVCIGRGTDAEEVVLFQAVDYEARVLETTPLAEDHDGFMVTNSGYTDLAVGPTSPEANYALLKPAAYFPPTRGILHSTELGVPFTATTGTTTSVTVPNITSKRYGGDFVKFTGNVTAALAGVIGYVLENDATTIYFSNTLPAAPANNDEFVILHNTVYLRYDNVSGETVFDRELPDLQFFPTGAKFYQAEARTRVSVAQLQVKSGGWDVIQSDPEHVEVLLPKKILENDIYSASYIRDTSTAGSAVISATVAPGDEYIEVADTTTISMVGVAEHGASTTKFFFINVHTYALLPANAGDTTLYVYDTSQFGATGDLLINGSSVSYTVSGPTELTVSALPADVRVDTLVRDEHKLWVPSKFNAPGGAAISDSIAIYTNYNSGDYHNVDKVWPGPYVWELADHNSRNHGVVPYTSTMIAARPKVSLQALAGSTALEVEDASTFPPGAPYSAIIGEGRGNEETVQVQDIALRTRAYSDLASDALIGSTTLQLSSLSGPTGPYHIFPNAGPYRVVVDFLTPDVEVLVVREHDGVDTLTLDAPVTKNHYTTATVHLVSDVLRLNPGLADDHVGLTSISEQLLFYPPVSPSPYVDDVRVIQSRLTLAAGTSEFPVEGGTILANHFGEQVASTTATNYPAAPGDTTIFCDNVSGFPTTGYPYIAILDEGAGPLLEEKVFVTHADHGAHELTISHPVVHSHALGAKVSYRPGKPETITYGSRDGNDLVFPGGLVSDGFHLLTEPLYASIGTDYPHDFGTEFPLRLPYTELDAIRFVLELVRAAGVEVTFIYKR